MQIIAGAQRGTHLKSLEGYATRPTQGRIVENIFNILQHNRFIDFFAFKDQYVLDLCAGSGRLGLEAYSRGARNICFVEQNIQAVKIIQSNITKCHAADYTKIIAKNVLNMDMFKGDNPFSLIFCDPPYKKNLPYLALKQVIMQGWVAHNALFCVESEKDYILPTIENLKYLNIRHYGETSVHFLKYSKNEL